MSEESSTSFLHPHQPSWRLLYCVSAHCLLRYREGVVGQPTFLLLLPHDSSLLFLGPLKLGARLLISLVLSTPGSGRTSYGVLLFLQEARYQLPTTYTEYAVNMKEQHVPFRPGLSRSSPGLCRAGSLEPWVLGLGCLQGARRYLDKTLVAFSCCSLQG